MRVTNKPILLVEDDRLDKMTVMRALKQIHVINKVIHLENGEDALNTTSGMRTATNPASSCST